MCDRTEELIDPLQLSFALLTRAVFVCHIRDASPPSFRVRHGQQRRDPSRWNSTRSMPSDRVTTLESLREEGETGEYYSIDMTDLNV